MGISGFHSIQRDADAWGKNFEDLFPIISATVLLGGRDSHGARLRASKFFARTTIKER